MSDIYAVKKRSEIMASVSGAETKPEILVRKYLFGLGFRYRKNFKLLPGKPDIVLRKFNTVIMVHGCFWHGHVNCRKASLPLTNRDFWSEKILSNQKRDARATRGLRQLGWKVITIWECRLRNKKLFESTMAKLVRRLSSAKDN